MAENVAVIRVTVDYAFGGKAFTVVFANPKEIRSIILNRDEFERLSIALGGPLEVPLEPSSPIPTTTPEGPTQAEGKESGSDSSVGDEFRGLWWHTGACTFFHPEKA